MLKPQIGIVAGVNEQHLALFGSLENLLSAEGGGELADSLSHDGILILNGDNKYCLDLYKKAKNPPDDHKKIYSLDNKKINADIWTEGIIVNKNSLSFLAIDKSREMANFDVKVLGKQNVQNLLAAIMTAKELGMNFAESARACKDILQEQAGMVLKNGKHGIFVIDSSYSSNPDGVLADLDYLSVFTGKKVIVMACLIELGGKSAQIHEKIGRKIAEICDLAIITSKDKFNEVKKGAVEAGMQEKDIVLYDRAQNIFSAITLFCKSGDAVLLEGRVPNELIKLLSA
jgi:UDP-N-acetylmuramoyl-tripeptide--D-alanyl-D-alanine ligase